MPLPIMRTLLCCDVADEFNQLLPAMDHPRAYCPPGSATGGPLVAVAVKHLRDHPSELHQPFIKLAVAALKEAAWPCAAYATEGAAAQYSARRAKSAS